MAIGKVLYPDGRPAYVSLSGKNFLPYLTAGFCPGRSQANVVLLPNKFAADFRLLCARKPVSCPLFGETKPGDPQVPEALAADSDVRTDCLPTMYISRDGVFAEQKESIEKEWRDDSVAFFIGCSYSFEAALVKNELPPRHLELNRAVLVNKTNYRLRYAGVFGGHMEVSMRPYRLVGFERMRDITRPFVKTHGERVAWDGEVPAYFGSGVTPQLSVMDSGISGEVVGHTPGRMLMLDIKDEDICLSF
ncbi:hypothetical protein IW261DRAFT_1583961 [Armillaria novae-zelandiae]|uniref:DUF1445 domain-containing protein n=1 Tax=Armillaria novae-zelandiae TaxID=153914 RepID=A0AA39UBT8_9AGAR|nr:hypothetical protein IW261DRAFT_1583961 [Armillaria novae-zelandiae]